MTKQLDVAAASEQADLALKGMIGNNANVHRVRVALRVLLGEIASQSGAANELRATLRGLMASTASVEAANAIAARQTAHAVYLGTLPGQTKAAMLAAAQATWNVSPDNMHARGASLCTTYREAIESFGTSLLDRVMAIGPQAAAAEWLVASRLTEDR